MLISVILKFNRCLFQFDVSGINTHSGKLMSERLLEFNNLELHRRLSVPEERQELVSEVRELLKTTYPDR